MVPSIPSYLALAVNASCRKSSTVLVWNIIEEEVSSILILLLIMTKGGRMTASVFYLLQGILRMRSVLFWRMKLYLPDSYRSENTVYGLINYIKSLHKLMSLTPQPMAIFPGHRLFYNGRFNLIHSLLGRAGEIIQFHIDRCSDILRIIDSKPTGLDEIVLQHFPASSLTGAGKRMARNEVMAHIEVMEKCGDVCWVGENRDRVQWTGSNNFLNVIGAYL
jgi:hypothetical protein